MTHYYCRHPAKAAMYAAWHRLYGSIATAEAIEADLKSQDRCPICGRRWTNEGSHELGIDPDCLAKLPLSQNEKAGLSSKEAGR